MKKVYISILLILTFLLSGCEKKYVYSGYRAREECYIILEAIKNNDPDAIEELFCDDMKENNPNLHEDIQQFIDYVDGDIVSVGEVEGYRGASNTAEYVGYTKEEYIGKIHDIQTDKGQFYDFTVRGYSTYISEPKRVGIDGIYIIDLGKYQETEDFKVAEYMLRSSDYK